MSRFFNLTLLLVLGVTITISGCGGGGNGSGGDGNDPVAPDKPGFIEISGASPREISSFIYGQNYWNWTAKEGDQIHGTSPRMDALKLNVFRLGGIGPDQQYPNDLSQSEIDEYIAYCRAIHAEPLLQVSIIGGDLNEAVHWVDYCNHQKGYNVKYWIIGNEPDLYVEMGFRSKYTVQNYINDFLAYAEAMKRVDPGIQLLGPELGYKYESGNDWLTPFLNQCKDKVDVVTFHAYPFGNAGDFTIPNVLYEQVTRGKIQSALSRVRSVCGTDKPVALTECNVSWNAPISGQPASPETFYAGLWLADIMGYSLEKNLWSVDFWSTCEKYAVGFLDPKTKAPRPIYYTFQMYTTHFGNRLIQVAKTPYGLAVFASRNMENSRTIVMVVNKTNQDHLETVSLKDITASREQSQFSFPPYSLTCLSIPDDESPIDRWTYIKALADRGEPPTYERMP